MASRWERICEPGSIFVSSQNSKVLIFFMYKYLQVIAKRQLFNFGNIL